MAHTRDQTSPLDVNSQSIKVAEGSPFAMRSPGMALERVNDDRTPLGFIMTHDPNARKMEAIRLASIGKLEFSSTSSNPFPDTGSDRTRLDVELNPLDP